LTGENPRIRSVSGVSDNRFEVFGVLSRVSGEVSGRSHEERDRKPVWPLKTAWAASPSDGGRWRSAIAGPSSTHTQAINYVVYIYSLNYNCSKLVIVLVNKKRVSCRNVVVNIYSSNRPTPTRSIYNIFKRCLSFCDEYINYVLIN